jgi:putative peptidoglycan lipid II flippase
MRGSNRHPLIAGTWVVGLGTLASRVLGMIRDVATAALLGMSGSGVMDAFVLAFRIPNVFRRLFGEGALAASYLPVLTEKLEKDRAEAWQLASVTLAGLAVLLTGLLVAIELGLAAAGLAWGGVPKVRLVVGLSAVMMPYMVAICVAAQVAATLNALGHFSVPALVPTILNLCWLVGVWVVAPWFDPDEQAQAYALAACVLVAGLLQLGVQLPVLRRLGFRFDYDWAASRDSIARIVAAMGPMVLGLAITQINTLLDSVIAWGFSSVPDGPQTIAWLGGAAYPMQQGATAVVYFGERLYQFPLGMLGLAVATAIFPLLSRHAARGDHARLGADLTLGLRLVFFLAVPASVGLILLAEPLARLLFEWKRCTAEDAARAARMIACYSGGVWAYCAAPVVVRGYYALGDRITPVRVGASVVALNLALNLLLIWPLAEAGLAVATSIAAAVQVLILTVLFSRRRVALGWPALRATALRTVVATALMAAVAAACLTRLPPAPELGARLVRVLVPLAAAMAVYAAAHWAMRGRDLAMLVRGAEEE